MTRTAPYLYALLAMSLCLLGPGIAQATTNPVTNGSFEVVDEAGQPADWELMGNVRVETTDAHSGQRALHLRREADEDGITGLNRTWAPGSGRQGTMLAQKRGGVRFWYKAVHAAPGASLSVQIIPMNDHPLETQPGRVRWMAPASHVADGLWHQGEVAYDFSGASTVTWVHVGARLYGGQCELWLDDIEWLEQVGPVLQPGGIALTEEPGQEGRQGTLTWTLQNIGGRLNPAGTARIQLPQGLRVESEEAAIPPIAPGESAELTWTISGVRDEPGVTLAVSAQAGELTATDGLSLTTELELVGLRASRMVLKPGQETTVRLLARNGGNAIAQGVGAQLSGPDGVHIEPLSADDSVPPGPDTEIGAWAVRAVEPALLARLRAHCSGQQVNLPLMVVERLPDSPQVLKPAYAFERGGQCVIGSERVRLVLRRAGDAYGFGVLQTRNTGDWQDAAMLPRLGLVATPDEEAVLTADRVWTRADDGTARLILRGRTTVAGVQWRLTWRLEANAGSDTIEYALTARPGCEARITALEGPMLYVGEVYPDERQDAILPGLEWLAPGEESSNALDIVPDHPDRVRYVPHPYKVTIPAAGMRFGDITVGLLWDAPLQQPSYATAGPASVVFASPNRFEGHTNHLMGLFLPSVGGFVPENERRASEPLVVPVGERVELRAELLAASGSPSALVVVDRWFERHGYPEALAYPRGGPKREVSFSLRGYFKDTALWNPEWGKWYSDLIVGFRPDTAPARHLLRGADVLGDSDVAQQARAIAVEVLGGDERGRRLKLEHRANPDAIAAQARKVRSYIATQHADGTWRFSGEKAGDPAGPSPDYAVLGPVGASEVGLTAAKASEVLRFALIVADPEATQAGLKAARAMRQFRIPRAAQVWEVPVHTPDIYASAWAVNAYVDAYRLTGEREFLVDAVYWARTGLPFVYVWAPEDMPLMQGVSIPVFGATGYGLSWFGVAVQWNGLGYANALLGLSEHDSSFPWRRVAENIARSAMYQQAKEGPRIAQWPDAVNLIEGRPGLHGSTNPCFQPATILNHLFGTLGLKTAPVTVAARQGSSHLAVRAMAELSDVSWVEDKLRLTATFAPTQQGAIEIIGTEKPSEVVLNGEPLAQREDVWAADEPGWHWHESVSDLEVRITRSGEHVIQVTGAVRTDRPRVPPALKQIDFGFDRTAEGWVAAHHLAEVSVVDGALHTESMGVDPYLVRSELAVPGKPGDELIIRMSATAGNANSIYFGTEQGGFSEARLITFSLPGDGHWHTVRVPVGNHAGWAGHTIDRLRIDPPGGDTGGRIAIDSIRLERRDQ